MKLFFLICLFISAVVAFPPRGLRSRSIAGPSPVNAAGSTGVNSVSPRQNYGKKAYGPGLNHPFARQPHPFIMQRALAVANRDPNLLVRVDVNGEVELTDRFGREVDAVYDRYGFDLLDTFDF